MNHSDSDSTNAGADANLKDCVLKEVKLVFQNSSSPQFSGAEVKAGVDLLFHVLNHRVEDMELDSVGSEIRAALKRWFIENKLVKLVDRYEPFIKFVLRIIDPSRYQQLQAESGNRLAAAKVLKALGLVTNKTLSLFESCAWDQFPPADVLGKPGLLEHVARTYVFRNVDDHQAREVSLHEKAQVAQSFCVVLVWCTIKFRQELDRALLRARYLGYLEKVLQRLAESSAGYVELSTETRSSAEFRLPGTGSEFQKHSACDTELEASKAVQSSRVIFIEAEPGAGKTTTLRYVAWRHADELLRGMSDQFSIPVLLELRLMAYRGQTIESAIKEDLGEGDHAALIPWGNYSGLKGRLLALRA